LLVETGQLVPVTAGRIETVSLFLENQSGSARTLRLRVVPAHDVWDLDVFEQWRMPEAMGGAPSRPPEIVAASESRVPAGHAGWTSFRLDAALPERSLVWLLLDACPGVWWREGTTIPPGTLAARPGARAAAHITNEAWWSVPSGRRGGPYIRTGTFRSLAARLTPASTPFGPANALNGIARPETWTNAWVSDPAQPMPHWLELELQREASIETACVTFDTNLSRPRGQGGFPGLWRAPECVRDYALSAYDESAGAWRELARVTNNFQRRRTHDFAPVRTRRVRLTVMATNGAPSATVYELRLYGARPGAGEAGEKEGLSP
jgi:hypothetical protein